MDSGNQTLVNGQSMRAWFWTVVGRAWLMVHGKESSGYHGHGNQSSGYHWSTNLALTTSPLTWLMDCGKESLVMDSGINQTG